MKYQVLFACALSVLVRLPLSAQTAALQRQQQLILAEGLALYESERTSWIATDLLMARQPDKNSLGGYVTYADGDSMRTVFFAQSPEKSTLTAQYVFSFPRTAILPTTGRLQRARPASVREQQLYALRRQVYEELTQPQVGGPYGFPPQTQPNIVLLDQGSAPQAYVLTGPQEAGVLPIGNDWLMTFTAAGKLQEVERLHNSYLGMRLPEGNKVVEGGMHTHLPAHPYITPTDICSLLLYQEAFPVKNHYVIGPKYVSIFDVTQKVLLLMEKKAFDKIYKSR
jgi:hypothetical protein